MNFEAPGYVCAVFAGLYISLQMFAIPGPVVLSVLAGMHARAAVLGSTACLI
jgi:hypothetical protein